MEFRNPDDLDEGEVMHARNEVLRGLVAELRRRSEWEAVHAERVAVYAVATGYALGFDDEALLRLRYAATLHDIGKLEWPDDLFASSVPNRSALAAHAIGGESRLRQIDFLIECADAVRSHHERWDGSGYPDGLMGDEIPLPARILAVSEAFDVLAHGSPWQSAIAAPFAELTPNLFDRNVVEALRKMRPLIHPIGT